MAKRAEMEKALKEKTILVGLAKICDRFKTSQGEFKEILRVYYKGEEILIDKEDAILYSYSPALARLVGSEVKFCIKEIDETDPSNIVYRGSMKEAKDVLIAPVLERLQAGEILKGMIVTATAHGAYIAVGDVRGFMKNLDFSESGDEIRNYYKKGDTIEVKFKKFSNDGFIYFIPTEKMKPSKVVKRKDIAKGMVMMGKIVSSFPDRVYVNVLPNLDCLCFTPKIGNYRDGDEVQVKIQRVTQAEKRLLVRGEILGKIPKRPAL